MMPKEKTQFKKGKSGNPKGRPAKVKYFSDTARELMAAKDIDVTWTVGGKVKTLKLTSSQDMHYGIAAALILEALKGNVVAARELVDRIEGKPLQKIDAELGGNITVRFDKEDREL